MPESTASPSMPIAASALSFGVTHLALRHGPVHRRLTAMYTRRKAAGLLQPNANPPELAAQAGSRILNEIHNVMVVRVDAGSMRLIQPRIFDSVVILRYQELLACSIFGRACGAVGFPQPFCSLWYAVEPRCVPVNGPAGRAKAS